MAGGTARINITQVADISLPVSDVNFTLGVAENKTACIADSTGSTVNCTGDSSAPSNGFLIQIDGNTNVDVTAKVGSTAASFIGGTSPAYKWKANNATEEGCINATGLDARWTAWEATSTSVTTICNEVQYTADSADSFELDIQLTVPEDAASGTSEDTITFTATPA